MSICPTTPTSIYRKKTDTGMETTVEFPYVKYRIFKSNGLTKVFRHVVYSQHGDTINFNVLGTLIYLLCCIAVNEWLSWNEFKQLL